MRVLAEKQVSGWLQQSLICTAQLTHLRSERVMPDAQEAHTEIRDA